MSVNKGYTFVSTNNTAGDRSAVEIDFAPDTTAYTKSWYMHGNVTLSWDSTSGYYLSCGDQRISFVHDDIAKINGADPNADPFTAFGELKAAMPKS